MLGIAAESKMVLISFGGIPEQITFFDRLTTLEDVRFVVAGGTDSFKIEKNLILIPHRSDYFHPDLVKAADAVIGKVGYSTVAEVYNAGTPFGYIPRPNSPEAPRLVEFIKQNMVGFVIEESIFRKGDWLTILREILRISPKKPITPNGADQVARFIYKLLD
jgi:UDP-N-acetylglucosamine:LPS N-acetylglucosamine transferase|tara:strand:- start:329 stop:814 length:486 start_codon:yes stop_codon:yes gene_type:complete